MYVCIRGGFEIRSNGDPCRTLPLDKRNGMRSTLLDLYLEIPFRQATNLQSHRKTTLRRRNKRQLHLREYGVNLTIRFHAWRRATPYRS
ncbi:hypothetical protein TWF102_006847 [Orbilia oligospora]|uniref:Uncharacterized protein n=1 Tax=Orbilia oligospora TaxID=2813651 RepID=A0A7C8J9P8_ORBOL|nr:hypothetical protein TWF102_006847 [Orbilia oligospora]